MRHHNSVVIEELVHSWESISKYKFIINVSQFVDICRIQVRRTHIQEFLWQFQKPRFPEGARVDRNIGWAFLDCRRPPCISEQTHKAASLDTNTVRAGTRYLLPASKTSYGLCRALHRCGASLSMACKKKRLEIAREAAKRKKKDLNPVVSKTSPTHGR